MAVLKRSVEAAGDSMNSMYPVPDSIELVFFSKSLSRNLPATVQGSKLELIPAELITKIFEYTPLTTRINLAMSSKYLAKIARTNGVLRFDPTNLTGSDLELLRRIMPFKVTAQPAGSAQIEPPVKHIWCSHCWNTKYAALELCQEAFWIGTGPAHDLRYHMKLDLKRRNYVAVINIKDIMHLIRGFVCEEKAKYMKKLNKTAFLSLKYPKTVVVAGK